jgi:hypothetical protein
MNTPQPHHSERSDTEILEVIETLARHVQDLHRGGVVRRPLGPAPASPADKSEHTSVLSLDAGSSVPPAPTRDLDGARRALADAGIVVFPDQLDLHQLGALLWQMLSDEPLDAYRHDARARAKLPPDLLGLVGQALGEPAGERFDDIGVFIAAVAALHEQRLRLPYDRLGHFILLSELGRGGMGEVFKAYEPPLQRLVALKVLPADVADRPERVRRFRAEAAAVARLNHPNVVPIYSVGEDRGRTFFAMQYVQGETLAQLLTRRGTLHVDETLALAEQILEGLNEAHAHGLIHRDIKPSNILLDARTGRALLADFGLVKDVHRAGELTHSGVVLGTVEYLSPEQAQGFVVDARSDLYAIGVLLFRALAGRLPFKADTAATLIFQHAFVPAPPLRQLRPDAPEALTRLVARLLAKSPDERYQTVRELLSALRGLRLHLASAGPKSAPAGIEQAPTRHEGATTVALVKVQRRSASGSAWRPWLGRLIGRAAAAAALALFAFLPSWLSREPAGPHIPKAAADRAESPDLAAAAWALRLHGRIKVSCLGQKRELADARDLPDLPLQLLEINLQANPQLTDAELARLPPLADLQDLILGGTPITDAGLRALPPLPALKSLHLAMTGVTDAGLTGLARFPSLTQLNLDATAVSGAGLSRVREASRLEHLMLAHTRIGDEGLRTLPAGARLKFLGLNHTKVTDASMPRIATYETLTHLQLAETELTDAGLLALRALRRLTHLDLRETRVSDNAVAAFRAALPGCQVVRNDAP